MSLNLITDEWIPVRRKDGSRVTIAPWQMADDSLEFPDWPRPDLNIACLELLIGLVFLADPPEDVEDWQDRQSPDPDRLREKLAPFAPAFNLLGDGPRFMQDQEAFKRGMTDPNGPDMLFIDSAGKQTARNNADLLVKRDRYTALDPSLAAMALYTLQAHAPSGGAGNLTSMRGGGPLVTLVDPGGGLWPLLWANVPEGTPADPSVLPWMRRTRSSEKGEQVFPQDAHLAEAFFGQPRRLRLVGQGGRITGVVQKPYGTNYTGWEHPLTPHYRQRPGAELLPVHPRAGHFGFRNWLGVAIQKAETSNDTARRAKVINLWGVRGSGRRAEAIIAGWAMDNMKPQDFIFSRAPIVDLPPHVAERMEGMVEAADIFATLLRGALAPVLAEGQAREAAREEFYVTTQVSFENHLMDLASDDANLAAISDAWLKRMRDVTVAIFDRHSLPGLAERETKAQDKIIRARCKLTAAFEGCGASGRKAFQALGLPIPEQGRKKGKAA
jgi:CRISPR system Cascade subunit CasA